MRLVSLSKKFFIFMLVQKTLNFIVYNFCINEREILFFNNKPRNASVQTQLQTMFVDFGFKTTLEVLHSLLLF